MKLESMAEIFLVTILVVLGVAVAGALVWYSFIQIQPGLLEGFFGAFMGAFFAFLFVRLADVLTRIHERKSKNRTALVILQHHFNDCLLTIGDDIYICDEYLKYYEQLVKDKQHVSVFANDFQPVLNLRDHLPKLLNLDFINELSVFTAHIKKLNDSMGTMSKMISQINSALVEGRLNKEDFILNSANIKQQVLTLKAFLEASLNELQMLYATCRVLTKDETMVSRLMRIFTNSRYTEKQKLDIRLELAKLRAELTESDEQSGARIEKITSGANNTAQIHKHDKDYTAPTGTVP